MATPPSHTGQVLHTGCDNQVIDQSYSKILAALPDSDRALQVLFGRSRISVRPVLNQNNAMSSIQDGCLENFSRVHKACVSSPYAHGLGSNYHVVGIQVEADKLLTV